MRSDVRGKVAVFDIAPDTIIMNAMFVDPAPISTPSLPAPIPTPHGERRLAGVVGWFGRGDADPFGSAVIWRSAEEAGGYSA